MERRAGRVVRRWLGGLCLGFVACGFLAGCKNFRPKPSEPYVYVTAKQAYLRDRVAAVSNRTGEVQNGDRLKVLDHARHFVKVQNEKGAIGWLEEKAVATPEVASEFAQLKDQHKDDAAVASAVVRDQVYLHLKPGRDTEHFYLMAEGEKLSLLRRTSLMKAASAPSPAQHAHKAIPQAAGSNARVTPPVAPANAKASADEPPAPPAYEDWWLARDAQGHAGWVLARMIDVDAPDALTRYAEGQHIVGAYVLTRVYDGEAPGDDKNVPVYVTVLSPYKAGLPYDFDQVRVFTWSTAKHRYETGFREKNVEGFLPIEITKMKDQYGKSAIAQQDLPAFRYKVLSADSPPVTFDPATGTYSPGKTVTKTYRLEGNIVHRMGAPGSTAGEQLAHPVLEAKKDKKGKKKR